MRPIHTENENAAFDNNNNNNNNNNNGFV